MSAFRAARPLVPALLILSLTIATLSLFSRATLSPADFTFSNGAEPSSLDPHDATGVPEGRILRAIFEGLCVLDPVTCTPIPGMAESWEISPDELTYTFHLRRDSHWTNGDEVTSFDFKSGFEHLLDPRSAAEYAYLLWCVKGARSFTTTVDAAGTPLHSFDTVGIHSPDAHTLIVELERPTPWFLFLTAYHPLSPLNRRALEEMQARFPATWRTERQRPEHMVVNGPYRISERRIDDRIRLVKNDGYWDRDHVAFTTIDALAGGELITNMNLYLTGALGFVNEVPASLIPRLRGREDFHPAPYLATCFLRVNVTRPPLDDPRVRRALALAIDRDAITRRITKGGETPLFSVVPDSIATVSGYRPASLRAPLRESEPPSFAHDIVEARQLLADAGYGPGRRALRPIEIHYASQSTNKDVAEVVAHAWRENLGVDARLVNQEKKVALDTQRRLDYDISRSSWIADFPDPITFLEIFGGSNANNRTGWHDARYDGLLQRALDARGAERDGLYRAAESLLLESLPILPLYSFTTTSLVDPRLGGFEPNALDVHCPKFWYWMDDDELAAKRAAHPAASMSASHGPHAGLYARASHEHRPVHAEASSR